MLYSPAIRFPTLTNPLGQNSHSSLSRLGHSGTFQVAIVSGTWRSSISHSTASFGAVTW